MAVAVEKGRSGRVNGAWATKRKGEERVDEEGMRRRSTDVEGEGVRTLRCVSVREAPKSEEGEALAAKVQGRSQPTIKAFFIKQKNLSYEDSTPPKSSKPEPEPHVSRENKSGERPPCPATDPGGGSPLQAGAGAAAAIERWRNGQGGLGARALGERVREREREREKERG